VIPLDRDHLDTIAEMIGDTPFTVTPHFLLRRHHCDVYANASGQPRYGVIVPHTPHPDVHLFGTAALEPAEIEELATFLARMQLIGGYLVPVELVPPLRTRRRIQSKVEGLCFTYRRIPKSLTVWRPDLVRQLATTDTASVEALPEEAGFLYRNLGTPDSLLSEGLAFGVFQQGRLVSLATSLALTPKYCSVGVYTLPRFRHLGYATDCVEAIFAHLFAQGKRPLWRIGVRQKVAIYFAEKLEMEEIGTDGQEVYLQACPTC
jgi:GNAT superfamily N-acetyltransferase